MCTDILLGGDGDTGWTHSDDQRTMVSWQPLTSPTHLTFEIAWSNSLFFATTECMSKTNAIELRFGFPDVTIQGDSYDFSIHPWSSPSLYDLIHYLSINNHLLLFFYVFLLSPHSQVSVFPVHSFFSMPDSMLSLLHLQRDCLLIIHDFSFPVHPFLIYHSLLHRSRKVIVLFAATTSLIALVPSSRISLAVVQPSFHYVFLSLFYLSFFVLTTQIQFL